ncbi:MAG: two-component regulator propeller domain-containing protein [Candidatus Kapaibacterium sp.]
MKTRYSIISLALALFFASNAYSQHPQWIHFSTANSLLTGDTVKGITFDGNGSAWFYSEILGGTGALSQLTGSMWKIHNEISASMYSNIIDPLVYYNKDIWAGNVGEGAIDGLSKFDGTSWTTYTTDNSGLADQPIVCLMPDINNDLWIGTQRGLNRLSGGITWSTYMPDNVPAMPYYGISSLATDAHANLWMTFIGTHGFVEFPAGDASRAKFFYQDSIPHFPMDAGIAVYMQCIAVDGGGDLWTGTESNGAVKLDASGATVYNTETTSAFRNNNVHSIAIDQCGHVWAGTDLGAMRYDGSWTSFTISSGQLTNDTVNTISVDAAGHIWFGTNGGATEFKPLPEKPSLSSPANWATIMTDSITCKWYRDCPGILKYWHEIADNPNFTNSHIDTTSTSLTSNVSKWDTILVNHATYYWRVKAENDAGWGPFSDTWSFTVNQVSGVGEGMTNSQTLAQNFPNPCAGATTIRFSLANYQHVTLKCYDILGRGIATLLESDLKEGQYNILFNTSLVPNGSYFYSLRAGGSSMQRTMQVVH